MWHGRSSGFKLVNGWIDGDVDRMFTDRRPATTEPYDFRGELRFAADYHHQYLAKNSNGCCGIGGCGIPYRSKVSAATNFESLDRGGFR